MLWDFAEANVLGEKSVCWRNAVEITAGAIESIASFDTPQGTARQADAAKRGSSLCDFLVSTDPPYYDNISYAGLSDFFYIWLRRSIGEQYPDLFSTVLVPKMPELTASPERFGGDKEKAKKHFEAGFGEAFAALREKMDVRFPLTVYYAFKQDDEEGDASSLADGAPGVDLTTGWETLLEALIGSGLQITATWPVRASQAWRMRAMGSNALASYIVLACRSRPEGVPLASRREFLTELKLRLPDALKSLRHGNIAPVDVAQAAIGPGMSVFSSYAKVMEADGSSMRVRTALGLINQVLDEALTQQEGEFDANTRWALAWFDQYGFSEGKFGDAETLSKAKNTSVSGLEEAGILHSKAGQVRLLSRAELKEDWDPKDDSRLALWEVTQHLVRRHELAGEEAAAALLREVGGGLGDAAKTLAYRLHKICEDNKWAQEALPYNALVISWPEISRLAQAAPAETARTGKLFE